MFSTRACELVIAALLLVGIGLLFSTHDLQSNSAHLMFQSQEVLHSSEHVLSLAKDIESSQRGYLITTDPEYLKPYDKAVAELPREMARLRAMACDTPEMKQLIERIGQLTVQRQIWAAELIQAHQQGLDGRETNMIRTARGQQMMDELRNQVEALQRRQTTYILAQEQSSASAKRKTRLIAVALVLLSGLASLFASAQARKQRLLKEKANDVLVRRTHELEQLHAAEVRAHDRARLLNEELAAANKRAEEAIAARARILATITEEVRTPLRSIAGVSRSLMDVTLDQHRESVREIGSTAESLVELLDDVLQFTRVGDGRLTLRMGAFSLRAVCTEVCSMMRVPAAEKDITVALTYDDNLPELFVGDSQCVRQVLTHLIGNGVKFTPQGKVVCSVYSNGTVENGVNISVTDTGIGIPAERLPSMFLPFPQAVREHGFDGSGLGLSICKELVELMGGEISVSSKPGNGTTFLVKLWMSPARPEASAEKLSTGALAPFKSTHILIYDNDAPSQQFCKTMLERLGATVHLVSTGPECVSACGLRPFDLLLADCSLPESDAFRAAHDLRRLGIANGLPIVGLVTSITPALRQKCVAAGMDECIGKPPDTEALVSLCTVISRKSKFKNRQA